MGWSLGADVRGLFREDSEFAKPMLEDTHCENCGDAYPARDIIEGSCFCALMGIRRGYTSGLKRGGSNGGGAGVHD